MTLLLRLQDSKVISPQGLAVEFHRESPGSPLMANVMSPALQAPWMLRGEVADALRAWLEGRLQARPNDNGIVDLVAAWSAQEGARALQGGRPTSVNEIKAQGPVPFSLTPQPVPPQVLWADEPEEFSADEPSVPPVRPPGGLPYTVDPAKITARIKGSTQKG